MAKYQFNEAELALMEDSCIPFAVYQFIGRRIVTLLLSRGFCELYNYTRKEAYDLMDRDMYRDTHPDDKARAASAAVHFATEGGQYDIVYRVNVAGKWRVIHSFGEHIHTSTGERLAVIWYTDEGLYNPESEDAGSTLNHTLSRALHEETFYRQSVYDHLTGLPKMNYFFELADAGQNLMLKEGRRPALLYFNFVGMKYFNRKFGFAKGNSLLRSFAKILARHFGNDNSSRLAQDNFAALTSDDRVEEELEQVFAECEALNDGNSLPVHAGVYLHKDEPIDISTACDRAKYACTYAHMSHLSGYRYFNETMLERMQNQQYVVDNLDRALRERWVQVHYQAIVRSTNGQVCDEEALARWIDPERGILAPAEFVPVLEDAKLAYRLDLYVLDRILEKMQEEDRLGIDVVPHSLNLSRTDFDRDGIVDEICRRVDAAGIAHDRLTIEITESVVGRDLDFMRGQVRRFQELGFKVWMDDFGSGYSSMEVLQTIHFDLIKFDMSFLRRFDQGDESKVILTALMRMATGLGIDTLVEGVETKEQAEFLRELGCNKQQGFYYSRPVPFETIVERYRNGALIGFENQAESDYYAAVGKANLFDLSAFTYEQNVGAQRYFDAIPMAILEVDDTSFWFTRCNNAYKEYMVETFGAIHLGRATRHDMQSDGRGTSFSNAIVQCARDGNLVLMDEEIKPGQTTHAMVRRVAVNPVTGTAALVIAILAVVDNTTQNTPVTYANIAKALSSDYRFLFYVDLDSERFVEYSSNLSHGDLMLERHGESFFQASRDDARYLLYEPDQQAFIDIFTKERVLRDIDEHGAFTTTYRLCLDGAPRYMNMKATRIGVSDNHIIIGVSDVDAQITQERALQRVKSEQIAYTRIMALVNDILCVYVVDPKTTHFMEYRVTQDYADIGIRTQGEDFFESSHKESLHAIHEDDRDRVNQALTLENVLRTIREDGSFAIMGYRLMMGGVATRVNLKAALVDEDDGQKLLFGVIRA